MSSNEPVIPVLMMVAGGVLLYAGVKGYKPQDVIKNLLTGNSTAGTTTKAAVTDATVTSFV